MGFSLGSVGKALGDIVTGGAVSAYENAKAQKKALKVKRDADIKVLQSESEASLKSIAADTEAQAQVIQSEANARIKAALYEADTEGQNIEISRLLGRDAANRGLLEEFAFRREASQVMGTQRATLASSGVDINTGSAAYLQEELFVATDLDALAIRQDAQREQYGYAVEAYAGSRRQRLAQMEAASTGEVAAANIKGLRETSRTKAEGIRKVALENQKAIRKVTEAGFQGISPTSSFIAQSAQTAQQYASMWYLNR